MTNHTPVPAPAKSLLTFPSTVPVTAIGKRVDNLAQEISATVRTIVPGFDPATIELRASKANNYLAVAFSVYFESRAQMDELDAALRAHPLVKLVL
jgi:putative lipoic acid-binding regulatory protein